MSSNAAIGGPTVVVDRDQVVVTSPEGQRNTAPLVDVVQALVPRWFPDCIWPDGVKLVYETPRGAVVVHQTPSRVHNLQWIAEDSPAEYGEGAKYRRVRVALPYVIILAAFRPDRRGRLQLSQANECFFANAPLRSVDDPLLYPALLNVSKMPGVRKGRPWAWLCSQYLDRSFQKLMDPGVRARTAVETLVRHLLEDGFNRSSEHNEGASWFGETVAAAVDERVASIESWERATAEDPLFATEVPWLPTGKSVKQMMERIAENLSIAAPAAWSAVDLARVVSNRTTRSAS